jgi:hypothetical protein
MNEKLGIFLTFMALSLIGLLVVSGLVKWAEMFGVISG